MDKIIIDVGKSQLIILSDHTEESIVLLDAEIRQGIIKLSPDEALGLAMGLLEKVQSVLDQR